MEPASCRSRAGRHDGRALIGGAETADESEIGDHRHIMTTSPDRIPHLFTHAA
jgi:hypothetical protein